MTDEKTRQTDAPQRLSFEQAVDQVWRKVERGLTTGPSLIRGYTGHLAKSQGKGLRATALLTCAQGEDDTVPVDAISFAAALELLHTATLVHDDVIDDADLRRGEPSLQKMYGKRTAVICGDWLLATALRTAAQVENRETYLKFSLPDYVGRVCLGELSQHVNNWNLDLSVYSYLRIIGGKTAALFEGAFYAGAICATDEVQQLRTFCRLGRYIGMIFQLTDDCIDFEEDRSSALKPVQSDFEQGVVTLPLICALRKDPAFKARLSAGGVTREELNERVRLAQGLNFTRLYAARYYDKALSALEKLELTHTQRQRLQAILDKAYYGLRKG